MICLGEKRIRPNTGLLYSLQSYSNTWI